MRLFDTHTHLYLPEFDEDGGGDAAVRRAVDAGVEAMLMPNVDLTTIEPLRALQGRHPERIYVAMGLHPTEVGAGWRDDVAQALEALRPDDVAIGEVGMDLYWDRTFRDEQMQALEVQAQRAAELDLPLVIHCREALGETHTCGHHPRAPAARDRLAIPRARAPSRQAQRERLHRRHRRARSRRPRPPPRGGGRHHLPQRPHLPPHPINFTPYHTFYGWPRP